MEYRLMQKDILFISIKTYKKKLFLCSSLGHLMPEWSASYCKINPLYLCYLFGCGSVKKIRGALFIKHMITSLDSFLFSYCLERCFLYKNAFEFKGIFGFFNEKKIN